ncbi:CinA family nicotinamide mononucleotide deamidase-related protein [Candidatus Uabimicrobium amorphum]|uniref:CinA-like protein n=1 Tax=Uabimicrobium amorphum TaxID=2596890 RepID=A0A5S9IT32_UABAM|nr:CinA family nicotinamide mononucleotide deamidase-related protein [Candidatus Uabimicrobium amorphum]BBM87648.1 CinA-like protein [Candidatus Uabimicrobium amorphum]
MIAHILSIGAELTEGRVVNTNATFLAQQTQQLGIGVSRITTIGDDIQEITELLSAQKDTVVITTGGLGPTHDDITHEALYAFCHKNFDDFLEKDEWYCIIKKYAKNREISSVHAHAQLLKNPVGHAPGFYVEANGCHIFVLPGVPSEAEGMFQEEVLPLLKKMAQKYHSHTLRLSGMYESKVQKILEKIQGRSQVDISLLPQYNGVDIVVKSRNEINAFVDEARAQLQKYIYSENGSSLEETIAKLLIDQKKTIAVAESCSGGFTTHLLTNVSGSSAYLQYAVVSYSNEAKIKILGVDPQTITAHGAVSPECAREMAQGVRKVMGTDIGIATTGISGPTGATPNKPLGLVYVAYADSDHCVVRDKVIRRPRVEHKKHSAYFVLNLLWERLKK